MGSLEPPVIIRVGDRIRVSMAPAGSLSFRPVTFTVRAIGRWDFETVDLLCDADDPAFSSTALDHVHWYEFAPGGGLELVAREDQGNPPVDDSRGGGSLEAVVPRLREYRAIVWTSDPDKPGQRVEVLAGTLEEARAKLQATYGEEVVISLWSEEDAARPR